MLYMKISKVAEISNREHIIDKMGHFVATTHDSATVFYLDPCGSYRSHGTAMCSIFCLIFWISWHSDKAWQVRKWYILSHRDISGLIMVQFIINETSNQLHQLNPMPRSFLSWFLNSAWKRHWCPTFMTLRDLLPHFRLGCVLCLDHVLMVSLPKPSCHSWASHDIPCGATHIWNNPAFRMPDPSWTKKQSPAGPQGS